MLKQTINFHFKFSFIFLIMAVFFGFFYSLNLLGYASEILNPTYALSLHISLMLYGFPSLMLSMLPFALFDKDGLEDEKGLHYLNLYFIVWYIFLIFMIMSLLFGNQRGLVFYDYPYALNFLLAFSGLFFLLSILRYIRHYEVKPLWVKVSLASVIVAPFLLVLLMNPDYGQVENMAMGPHGDNTLGMSFALLVLYYLIIKLHAKGEFKARFHWMWIVPLVFYVLSVLYRIVIGSLSYNQEWFFQWLTFLYVPVLYFWFKDAGLTIKENMFLYISILAFLFVDIQGNILFIPELRELFHRNDLVVGHAHVAVGLSMMFSSFAVVKNYFKINNTMVILWASMLTLMAAALTVSGFGQAGFMPMTTETMWILRSLYGFLFLLLIVKFYSAYIKVRTFSKLELYHIGGFLADGLGAVLLLLFAASAYKFLGLDYRVGYQSVVYGFMFAVGVMHLLGYLNKAWATPMAIATVISRVMVAAIFFALYTAGTLDWIALGVSGYDLVYALIYILFLYKVEKREI
jgi:hypothetical protein